MAPSYYWIKMYHEVLHDPKMGRLSDHLWRRFFEFCLIAGETDDGGNLPLIGDMAWTLRTTPGDLEADLHLLAENGLVHLIGENWVVTKFADRQAPLSPAERKARQRKRDKQRDYYRDEPVTQDVTNRDTDTDTDTDTDQKKIQRQRQTTDKIGADAAECLRAVLDLGITEPKASQLVRQRCDNGGLDTLVSDLQAWIIHHKSTDGVRNPIGLSIAQVESGIPPPLGASGRRVREMTF